MVEKQVFPGLLAQAEAAAAEPTEAEIDAALVGSGEVPEASDAVKVGYWMRVVQDATDRIQTLREEMRLARELREEPSVQRVRQQAARSLKVLGIARRELARLGQAK